MHTVTHIIWCDSQVMGVEQRSAYIRRIFIWQQGNVPYVVADTRNVPYVVADTRNVPYVVADTRNFLPSSKAQLNLLLWDCIELRLQTVIF
jgi:hypothetical protein